MATETRQDAAAYWKRAADREELNGNPVTAVTFRNMAWLLEHPEGWAQYMASQSRERVS